MLFVVSLFFGACGGAHTSDESESGSFDPEFHDVSFDSEAAEGGDSVKVDTSHSSKGYFGVLYEGEDRIKLQVVKDEDNYIYDLPSGVTSFFPFSLGDGSYKIRVMRNVEDDKYSELFSTETAVSLDTEFEPYLRSNQYAAYTKDSACVSKASELAGEASGVNDFITNVYNYVCEHVSYDPEKAASVKSGYIPAPDEALSSGKGICFDYAALAASMLRSQGVPTKIIFGYVGDKSDIYHAWNMYYTKEDGWVAVEFKVGPDDWNRLDLTFSANGEDSDFIGDGSNYTDVYVY